MITPGCLGHELEGGVLGACFQECLSPCSGTELLHTAAAQWGKM